MLVVDASALAGWLLPDEAGLDIEALVAAHDVFCAPWRLWVEFRNILIVRERRGRLPQGMAEQMIEAVGGLGIELDTAPSSAAVLALSRKHGLTVHDALHLQRAHRGEAVLATLDRALARAAGAEAVPVVRPWRAGRHPCP